MEVKLGHPATFIIMRTAYVEQSGQETNHLVSNGTFWFLHCWIMLY